MLDAAEGVLWFYVLLVVPGIPNEGLQKECMFIAAFGWTSALLFRGEDVVLDGPRA